MNTKADATWALVTGASSGIGLEMAKELASQGMKLVLVARRKEALDSLAAELKVRGTEAIVEPADLSKPGEPERLFASLAARKIAVSVLVNNAGFGSYGPFDAIDPSVEEGMIDLNIKALVRMTRLFVAPMRAAGFGRLLFVSSIAAFQPSPGYTTYSATKSFVMSYALAARRELRNAGVSVTVLYPGVTATEFHDIAQDALHKSAFKRATAMSAQAVAKAAIRGLLSGKPEVAPGFANKLMIFSNRFVPRTLAAAIAGKLMKV